MSRLGDWLRGAARALRREPPEERASEGPHAQFGEDRILERIFAGTAHGHCVEVGAYDGITGSATYRFERKGWDCLLVEPNPALAQRIAETRRSPVVNCAASATEGEATFHLAERLEQMSALDLTPSQRAAIEELGGAVSQTTVPIRTLDALLDDAGFPRLDFVTIDVEGHELDVLRGFSLERHRPRIVILEDNPQTGSAEVERHMASRGYVNFRRTGVNDWYAHESDAELVQPDAVRRFRAEKAMRRRLEPLKAAVLRLTGRRR